jgi:hypothetical protein
MSTKFLKPKVAGQTVRDPKTGLNLPDAGAEVEMTTFWNRRLKDESVVEVVRAAEPQPEERAPVLENRPEEE